MIVQAWSQRWYFWRMTTDLVVVSLVCSESSDSIVILHSQSRTDL